MIGDFPRSTKEIAGGVESVMLYLTRDLSRCSEFEIDVVTIDRWNLGDRLIESDGFKVHYLAQSPLRGPAWRLHNIHRMRSYIKGLAPDIAHVHVAGLCSDAVRKTGIPWVLTLHGVRFLEAQLLRGPGDRSYRRWLITREEQRGVREAPILISISPFIEETFKDQIRGQVFRIENPIDDQFFDLEQENEPFSLLYLGRLTPRKDIMTLLRAFRRVLKSRPRAKLRLLGACDPVDPLDYCQQLHDYAEKHSLMDNLEFAGGVDEPRVLKECSRASVVVLSAVLETAPMAIMQSLAAGTAVVTSDAGGCRYLVDDGKSGRVVPQRDPVSLANAIIDVFGPDGRALEMGTYGRTVAEDRFRVRRVTERTLSVYHTALEQQT